MLVQPTATARSAKAPIRLNPVNICFMAFPFFWLVVWSGFDFPVSYRWFDWLLLAGLFFDRRFASLNPRSGVLDVRGAGKPPRAALRWNRCGPGCTTSYRPALG